MTVFVSIKDLEKELSSLAPKLAAGERVIVTMDGAPVFDLKPHEDVTPEQPKKTGIDWEAGRRYLLSKGIANPVPYVAPDFDDPLPEDFLIRPLPFD
ncbi:MAG TPA: prevent-host-death protein [Mesorhizobium sp.]|nr:prevent-host-death protein [Mesorhizobium sp.]